MFQAVENQFIKKSLTQTPIQEEDSIYSGEFSTEPEEVTIESEEINTEQEEVTIELEEDSTEPEVFIIEPEEVTIDSEEVSIESWGSGCTEVDELSCIQEENGCIEENCSLDGHGSIMSNSDELKRMAHAHTTAMMMGCHDSEDLPFCAPSCS